MWLIPESVIFKRESHAINIFHDSKSKNIHVNGNWNCPIFFLDSIKIRINTPKTPTRGQRARSHCRANGGGCETPSAQGCALRAGGKVFESRTCKIIIKWTEWTVVVCSPLQFLSAHGSPLWSGTPPVHSTQISRGRRTREAGSPRWTVRSGRRERGRGEIINNICKNAKILQVCTKCSSSVCTATSSTAKVTRWATTGAQ